MSEQQNPNTEGKPESKPHQQVSMALGRSEWQEDRELQDKPDPNSAPEESDRQLPPETPVNYRQRP